MDHKKNSKKDSRNFFNSLSSDEKPDQFSGFNTLYVLVPLTLSKKTKKESVFLY